MVDRGLYACALAGNKVATIVVCDFSRRSSRSQTKELTEECSTGFVIGKKDRIAELSGCANQGHGRGVLPVRNGRGRIGIIESNSQSHDVWIGQREAGIAESAERKYGSTVRSSIEHLLGVPVDADRRFAPIFAKSSGGDVDRKCSGAGARRRSCTGRRGSG